MKNLILLMIVLFSISSQAKLVEKIIAIVNNEVITYSSLNTFTKEVQQKKYNGVLASFIDLKTLKTRTDHLNFLINEKLILSEVKKLNLNLSEKQVEQKIKSIAKREGQTFSQLKKSIEKTGVSFSKYEANVKTQLETQSLLEKEIVSNIKISDDDILDHYLKTTGAKNHIFTFKIAHILLLKNKSSDPLKKIKELQKLLNSGKDFAILAKKFSQDPNFQSGGLLGTFRSEEVRPEIRNGVKGLEVGKISQVIESPYGYSILKLLDKKLVANQVDEQVKMKIRNELFVKLYQTNFKAWLENKKKNAFIKINPPVKSSKASS